MSDPFAMPRFGKNSMDPSQPTSRRFIRTTHDKEGNYITVDAPDINSDKAPAQAWVLHMLDDQPKSVYQLLDEISLSPEVGDPDPTWPPSELEVAFALGWLVAHGMARAVQ